MGLDFHYYTVVGTRGAKGSATDFTEAEWFTALRKADGGRRSHHAAFGIMDQFDPQKRVWLIVGEWGMWHDVEPGTNPGFLYQQNTMRDALVASTLAQHLQQARRPRADGKHRADHQRAPVACS